MGHRIHDVRERHSATNAALRLCAFPGRVARRGDGGVLSRGPAARAGNRGAAGQEEAAGLVHAGGGGGAVGVWVLL